MVRVKSELAGKEVIIKRGDFEGEIFFVEDWWENLAGKSWKFCKNNPACINYATRVFTETGDFGDDDVLYGHFSNGLGELVHITEVKGDENEHSINETALEGGK